MSTTLRTVFLALLVLIAVVFVIYLLQNGQGTEVVFLFFRWHGPAWAPAATFGGAVLVLALLYGLIAGAGWRFRHRRLQRVAIENESRASGLEEDLRALRGEPPRGPRGGGRER